jgi:hypothetical protein
MFLNFKALSPYREEMSGDVGKTQQSAEAKEMIKKVKSEFETKMSKRLEHCPYTHWCFSRRIEIHQRFNLQAQENAEEAADVAGSVTGRG